MGNPFSRMLCGHVGVSSVKMEFALWAQVEVVLEKSCAVRVQGMQQRALYSQISLDSSHIKLNRILLSCSHVRNLNSYETMVHTLTTTHTTRNIISPQGTSRSSKQDPSAIRIGLGYAII
jgi:hypothetical protein